MSTVYIVGHKNPDTDSVCSAIAYAGYKSISEKGHIFKPSRLGPINRETRFVLEYFKVPEPEPIENVYTQVGDIAFDEPLNILKNSPLSETWETMMKHNARTVNIVDESGKFLGLATLGDIAKAYLESSGDFSKFKVPMQNIINTLDGAAVLQNEDFFNGNIIVAAMQADDVRKRLRKGDLLITGNREDVQLLAVEHGAGVLAITGNHDVSEQIKKRAEQKGVTVIRVPHDTFDTVKLINQSIPIHYIMKTDNLAVFRTDDLIEDVKEAMLKYKYRNFPILDHDGKPVGMLARRHILDHARKNVILVDHNEMSQSVKGIEEARILEIIDHHRICCMETDQPIVFINKPVGCTATIILDLYEQKGFIPDRIVAGLMCAAILSDTLVFKSPTCTSQDIRAAKKLAEIAGIDIERFSSAMFRAGTSLEGKSEEEIFYTDFKDFNTGKFKIGVSQVNLSQEISESLKSRMIRFMEKLKTEKNYDLLLLMLTDIINQGSEFLYVGECKEMLGRAFNVEISGESFRLPLVVSRKKQVIPRIISAINSW
ncbi:MAG: putative manganese-dependent inorganic diphosphatase [Tepidanaerobacteraceae bacterium]|jgi:manganese-dependent inorganic pyrophosphatase|nr:putative manganese-dependent inorganic diphosphatase [Tepidanaerobacteraceae bacterium]